MSDADWKEVARAMREEGVTQRVIAERLGRSLGVIQRALRSDEMRDRVAAERKRDLAFLALDTDDAGFYRLHAPRTIRKLPGRPLLAARRFACGEINLEQLSRELWGVKQ